jgi:hypothetical protein
MANRDFLSHRDAELLAWSGNFASLIIIAPLTYGVSAEQANAYNTLHNTFKEALETATEPSTRTRGTIAAKNDARTPLKEFARELFVGSAPPMDISQWKFETSTTRTSFDIEFPASVAAGSQVWLCAFWFNPRAQSGPACQPVTAYLAGGVGGSLQAA